MITLMLEAAGTSEMSVDFYQTAWRNIAKDSHNLFPFCLDT
jgi:hypothetical protein